MQNKIKTVKKLMFSLFALIFVILSVNLSGCIFRERPSVKERLKNGWDLDIPQSFKFLHEQFDYDGNWFGEHNAVYVFEYDRSDTEFFKDFKTEKNTDFESRVDRVIEFLKRSNNSEYNEQYTPDWEQEYIWYFMGDHYYEEQSEDIFLCSDRLFLIYFINAGLLYVYEYIS